MGYNVYILYSTKWNRYYVGQTKSVNLRLERHNKGLVKSTKGGLPWKIILNIDVKNRSEALKLERRIKKRGIKRFLEDNQFGV
jgi:putative endonuclease